ncbi:MAG: hypothetical protein GY748_17645 [Planctomycetaceae bacterium]|nr:hypothetical protein [Planctomycetaceae bacterium]
MAKLGTGRRRFKEWVKKRSDPKRPLMPLTHIASGVVAEDIINNEQILPKYCKNFGQDLAYFFYGRPAYRISADDVVKLEAACPFCFLFEPHLINDATSIHAFDTGAFVDRLYRHVIIDEMKVEDYCLDTDSTLPNKLISAAFLSPKSYIDGE